MTPPELAPLRAGDLGALRLFLESRFTPESLSNHIALNPGLSWRDPASGQYAIGGYWRRRPEIATVVELSPGVHRAALVERVVEAARGIGCELVLLEMPSGAREASFWRDVGFEPIDQVVEYEKAGVAHDVAAPEAPIRRYEPDDLRALVELERRSFPWLWWNSTAEVARYGEAPESEVWVVDAERGGLAGYVGITLRGAHGHLDRLAVAPETRRRGLGAALVAHALARFAGARARRITLTTQFDNVRAQPLYDRFGFRRTRYALTIYGRWLTRPRDRTP